LPASTGAWAEFPNLLELFVYHGSAVQPKRTWVIAPDAESLILRWNKLIKAPDADKEDLFHATLRDGEPADRHIRLVVKEGIPGFPANTTRLIDEKGPPPTPVGYAFRSFNRQWIIPDARVITQPNAELWASRSDKQVYLTVLSRSSPTNGPALTFTDLVPDLDHYNGRGGRVVPLWRDGSATQSNVKPGVLKVLGKVLGHTVTPEDFFAYIAAVAAHPAYTTHFKADLSTPGLRIPITGDPSLFAEAVKLGRRVLWLHTFGNRFASTKDGRAQSPPRMEQPPSIPKAGAISADKEKMPDTLEYDGVENRLKVGKHGFIDKVPAAVWAYEVSGKQVLLQWFSYRKKDRERPIIGDRRPPSKLGDIQPDHWLPEYSSDLMNVINVLGLLVELEPKQADLLEKICASPLITESELTEAGALETPVVVNEPKKKKEKPLNLFAP
jgi:hypothetical protein